MKKHVMLVIVIACLPFVVFAQDDALQGQTLYTSNFIVNDVQRNFTYYMPLDYGKKEKYPLIIFLHDNGETSKTFIKNFGDIIQPKADTTASVIIYPDAVNHHWMVAAPDSPNDITFFSLLISYFIELYQADANRVYIAGIGRGGEMAAHLRCAMPARLAAVALFTKNKGENCADANSVNAINTHDKPNAADIENAIDFLLEHQKK
jgi:poly(3-hydroxybutyrate) depolymerase